MQLKLSIGMFYFLRLFALSMKYFRYCARLPCDALTTLVPSCEINKLDKDQYQCVISLPVNSPARTTITVQIFVLIECSNF